MKLELGYTLVPSPGIVFTDDTSAANIPYMFILPKGSLEEGMMTPMMIINLISGKIVARSTSWDLCLRDMGISRHRISFHGTFRISNGK